MLKYISQYFDEVNIMQNNRTQQPTLIKYQEFQIILQLQKT